MDTSASLPHRVVITGMGCISPLGNGFSSTVASQRSASDCIAPVEAFDVSGCQGKTAGHVPDAWLTSPCRDADAPEQMNRAARFLLNAMGEARAAHPEFEPEIAVIGTTSGGMLLGERFFQSAVSGLLSRKAARWVRSYVPQAPVIDAMQSHGWNAPCRILSNACASGTNALGHGFSLVRTGKNRRVVCGGYDVLCQLVFAGFDALRAYTPELCRPFDSGRSGLVLGEGAAIFFLETMADAVAAGRPILAEVTGYGSSTDNHHLTQPNPDGSGPRLAMQRAIADAGVAADTIDYINAHGTATPFNDACEARAIAEVCPQAKVSSTKGQMGHSLGAAGAIEAAVCVLAMQDRFLPANLHFRQGDPGTALHVIAGQTLAASPKCVMSNSLGFGGANASIVLEAWPS